MCSLGGNVAENAGGPRAFKYGVTRDWTLGMTVTLMGGETLKLGRKTPKGVTGYDLVAMFVGSEGTFGVTSEITVRLIGKPSGSRADRGDAGRRHGGAGRQRHHPPRFPAARTRAHGPVVAGPRPFPGGVHVPRGRRGHPAARARWRGRWTGVGHPTLRRAVRRTGGAEVIVARDDADRERLWRTRRLCSPALRDAHRWKQSEDVVVPTGSIAELLRRVDEIAARSGCSPPPSVTRATATFT